MNDPIKIERKDWLAGIVLGALVGAAFLGVGGRAAMRVFAIASGVPAGFSIGGSVTVVFLGAVSGAAGGLFLVLSRRLFPTRRFWRTTLFWGLCLLIALRGLKPVNSLRLLVFLPVVALFGVAVQLAWCRVYLPWRAARVMSAGAPFTC